MRTKAEINNDGWFGIVPPRWRMVPLKSLFSFNKGLSITKEDLLDSGVPVVSYGQIHSRDNNCVDISNTQLRFVADSLAYSAPKAKLNQNGFAFADTSEDLDGCGNCVRIGNDLLNVFGGYHTIVLNPKCVFNSKFLAYAFMTDSWRWQIRRDLVDVKLFSVNQENLSETYVVLPPEKTQEQIVSYLDERCAAIDNDIARRREVIAKLREYRKSIITKAITNGLNPEVKMKDSGVEWIGLIPSAWKTTKIKSLFEIKKRIAGREGLTVLSITQDGIKPKDFSTGKGQFAQSYAHYQLVFPGEFAMNHMDLLTGWIDISSYEGVTSPDYRVFAIRDRDVCEPRYFRYLFQMCYTNKVFFGHANGVADKGRMRLQTDAFKNFVVPFPEIAEQSLIADYLDERCAAVDSVIMKQEQLIEKLCEYRKSIIHHAVTGKIDCSKGAVNA